VGFTPGGGARVTIGLVALGVKASLPTALEAFRAHRSRVDFDIVCVVNGVEPDAPALANLPPDVRVVTRRGNLGYTGGLHIARAHAGGEFMVWGQDDMMPCDGWLDALVEAAEASDRIAMVGSRQVDAAGNTHPLSSGRTAPGAGVGSWPGTPDAIVASDAPAFDTGWVSGAGALARLSAWDAVGGVNLHLWPINFVDLSYCVHVRAHGFGVRHAPGAQIEHAKRGSTSDALVRYTAGRNTAHLDAAGWPAVTARLGDVEASETEHPCSPWRGASISAIEAAQLEQASLAFLPLMAAYGAQRDEVRVAVADLQGAVASLDHVLESTSWRVTAPLRSVSRLVRRVLRRG
jgi:GT2 family glycosyltransferase